MHVKPRGRPCSHTNYVLTCDGYEEVLERCNGRCQLCGVAPEHTLRGHLFIDHDGMLGQWAVRGMLCERCNSSVEWRHRQGERELAYLRNPFYRRLLTEAGFDVPDQPAPSAAVYGSAGLTRAQIAAMFPEPPLRTVVDGGSLRPYGSIEYRHDPGGWQPLRRPKLPPRPITWEQLLYRRGPHRVKVLYRESR